MGLPLVAKTHQVPPKRPVDPPLWVARMPPVRTATPATGWRRDAAVIFFH
jgi:hypothetical protein